MGTTAINGDPCSSHKYTTESSNYTDSSNISINRTGQNTVYPPEIYNGFPSNWLTYTSTSSFPDSCDLAVVNNQSAAKSISINNTLSLDITTSSHSEEEREDADGYCGSVISGSGVYLASANAIINNEFFGYASSLNSNYTFSSSGVEWTWDEVDCFPPYYDWPSPQDNHEWTGTISA